MKLNQKERKTPAPCAPSPPCAFTRPGPQPPQRHPCATHWFGRLGSCKRQHNSVAWSRRQAPRRCRRRSVVAVETAGAGTERSAD